jgi:magnesium-transporting ATPase (P-type)
MMAHMETQVTVLRGEQQSTFYTYLHYLRRISRGIVLIISIAVTIPSSEIAPGDLIVIEAGVPVPCDCILLTGNVVVNESSLTGESIPVLKSPLPKDEDDLFDPEHHGKYALFNGTTILQVKPGLSQGPVLALAFATGFFTLKGQLIRSIMFPKPTKFKFYKESFRFVMFLAALGMIYTVFHVHLEIFCHLTQFMPFGSEYSGRWIFLHCRHVCSFWRTYLHWLVISFLHDMKMIR